LFVGTCFLTQSHPEKNSCDYMEPAGIMCFYIYESEEKM